jgi:gluconokinase
VDCRFSIGQNRQSAIGNRQSAIGNRQSAIGNRQSAMVLVLDLGSSSTRAMLYDEHANAVPGALARVPFDFVTGEDGRSEDNAREAFQRVVAALDALHAHLTNYQSPITSLGISSYASSLVCLDDRHTPITPVFTYADTRCAEDARQLRKQHNEMAALQRTGCRIRANYLPARIAWITRTMPDAFAQTRWFAAISDYVVLRLFGQMSAGISVASWSGLLNRETGDWDEKWLDALAISREQLPPITPSPQRGEGRERGLVLLPEWAARWPKFAQVQLHPQVGDGAAANIGSGCVDDSRIAITIGSTAAMRVVSLIENRQSPTIPVPILGTRSGIGEKIENPALWCYRVDHSHDLIGGATTEGGNVIAWAHKTLRLPQDADQAINAVKPDAHGMTVLPTFAGERSPGYAEDIRATLHGLSLDSSPAEMVRALMEGIAYRLATICDALRESGVARSDATLAGSGGALLASPTWCQIIADATGVPLHVADVPEATSRGVAELVIGNWLLDNAERQLPMTNYISFNPDSHRHSIYRAAMARQQELYATLVRSDG